MVDHQRWFNVESTLKTNLSVWNLSWFSTLIQRWINVEDQPNISWEKGWSSTLIQRWINVDDQPYFPWKLRLILNVDSTLNQRWESTLISKWLKNGWNLVEFRFSWRMVDDQRWFNVENLICAHWVCSRHSAYVCKMWLKHPHCGLVSGITLRQRYRKASQCLHICDSTQSNEADVSKSHFVLQ